MTAHDYNAGLEIMLAEWLDQELRDTPSTEAQQLIEQLKSSVLSGGKRSRPTLLRMTYQAYGGTLSSTLMSTALAIELHHQFLLIHDDVMDQDLERHGQPNLIGRYYQQYGRRSNLPNHMGILGGNLLFSFACQTILKDASLSANQKIAVLQLLQTTNIGVHYGQQLDLHNTISQSDQLTPGKLTLTHMLKTASYSTKLPMLCAAELLDLEPAERARINTFAIQFGILYQLINDYCDYFSSQSALNDATRHRDFKQGKVTFPLYYAIAHASAAESSFLRLHAGTQASQNVMNSVMSLLHTTGAERECRKQIQHCTEKVQSAVNKLAISSHWKRQFHNLVTQYSVL